MSGSLFHSKEFAANEYVGGDGQMHFEVIPIDGDCASLSHATWGAMIDLAEAHGMPRSVWPEFLSHSFGIDVPLDDIRTKQVLFRYHVLQLPQHAIEEQR